MIRVFNKFEPIPAGYVEVDTTSRGPFKDLSPFYLGPIQVSSGEYPEWCLLMENLWQYSKVYAIHADAAGEPTEKFFQWRAFGFCKNRADRYPVGKGMTPLYSWWHGKRLSYVEAKHQIYIPAYRDLVLRTESYRKLYNWVLQERDIALRDFDGYDHVSRNMTLHDVINDPKRSLGHAFIIYGLLTGEL